MSTLAFVFPGQGSQVVGMGTPAGEDLARRRRRLRGSRRHPRRTAQPPRLGRPGRGARPDRQRPAGAPGRLDRVPARPRGAARGDRPATARARPSPPATRWASTPRSSRPASCPSPTGSASSASVAASCRRRARAAPAHGRDHRPARRAPAPTSSRPARRTARSASPTATRPARSSSPACAPRSRRPPRPPGDWAPSARSCCRSASPPTRPLMAGAAEGMRAVLAGVAFSDPRAPAPGQRRRAPADHGRGLPGRARRAPDHRRRLDRGGRGDERRRGRRASSRSGPARCSPASSGGSPRRRDRPPR